MSVDLTKSKRDTDNLPANQYTADTLLKLKAIGEECAKTDELSHMLVENDHLAQARMWSRARLFKLINIMMDKPLNTDTMLFHAEMRGRISENLMLTQQYKAVKTHLTILERARDKAIELMEAISRKEEAKCQKQ